jgi:hypothetical protein
MIWPHPLSTPNINRLTNNIIEVKYNKGETLSKKLDFVKIIIINVIEDTMRKNYLFTNNCRAIENGYK